MKLKFTQHFKTMETNIGRIINDFYCGGFFGRNFDLENAKIVGEGEKWIVAETTSGEIRFTSFDNIFDKVFFIEKYTS